MKITDRTYLSKALNLHGLLGLLILVTLVISLQQYLLPEREFWDAVRPHYNNYLIFKYSFKHLITGLNLYELHPVDHGDYFKYSPTFALFMGLFYYLPNWLGLFFWNLLNTLVLYMGVKKLPGLKEKNKVFMLLFVLLELIGNLQNDQSNALMAGLILLSFSSFEKNNPNLASLFLVLGFYIKIFTVLGALMFFFYPKKSRFILYFMFWMLLFAALPLLVITLEALFTQYLNWNHILQADHDTRYGFSIFGIMHKWFGFNPPKLLLTLVGLLSLAIPLLYVKQYKFLLYKILYLSLVLMWVILFNHAAESSGYIIAMCGCALWFFYQPASSIRIILIVSTFIVVSLFSTDLMPAFLRKGFIYPYFIRTVPILILFLFAFYDLLIKPSYLNHNSRGNTLHLPED